MGEDVEILEAMSKKLAEELIARQAMRPDGPKDDPYGIIDAFTPEELTDVRPFVPPDVYDTSMFVDGPERGTEKPAAADPEPDDQGMARTGPAFVWVDDDEERPPEKTPKRLSRPD